MTDAAMDPHGNQPALVYGAPLDTAKTVMIMIHGRGAGPRDILSLAPALNRPEFACIAPGAQGGTWYPYSFMSPRGNNEPGISSALSVIDAIVTDLLSRGFPSHKIVLVGFSQGACLSSEFCLRHPRRYGGLIAFSGGLIGPPGTTWDDVTTKLDGMPIFLGCSDIDGHIPKERVIESEGVFTRLGARVTRKLYPGMGHLVNDDEIREGQKLLDGVLKST